MSECRDNVLFFIPSKEQKKLALELSERFIKSLDEQEIGFKAYVLQCLLDSFEETYNVDLKNGIAVKDGAQA